MKPDETLRDRISESKKPQPCGQSESGCYADKPDWFLQYFAPMGDFGKPYRDELFRRMTEDDNK